MEPQGVVVVGSISADVTAFTRRLPRRGETVLGDDVTLVLGGKGANQAVAAARAGAPTWLVGCVGTDPFGEIVSSALREASTLPSADRPRVRITPVCPGIFPFSVPVAGSQRWMSLSCPAERRVLPSGAKASDQL